LDNNYDGDDDDEDDDDDDDDDDDNDDDDEDDDDDGNDDDDDNDDEDDDDDNDEDDDDDDDDVELQRGSGLRILYNCTYNTLGCKRSKYNAYTLDAVPIRATVEFIAPLTTLDSK
jgi:hypothetical protein